MATQLVQDTLTHLPLPPYPSPALSHTPSPYHHSALNSPKQAAPLQPQTKINSYENPQRTRPDSPQSSSMQTRSEYSFHSDPSNPVVNGPVKQPTPTLFLSSPTGLGNARRGGPDAPRAASWMCVAVQAGAW